MSNLRVPVNRLRYKDPITAGLNPFNLMGLVPLLRNTALDHDPALVGPACGWCGTRTVLDGRHRWTASVMAGRPDLLCEEDPTWTESPS